MTAPATVRDFRVVLPPGWVRIPLGDDAEATVVALAAGRARGAAPPARENVRTALVATLTRAVREARTAGGIDLLMSVDGVAGLPVPASCLISFVEAEGPTDLPTLAAQLAGPSAEVSVATLDCGPAVRRQSTRLAREGSIDVVLTELTFWVPVPGRTGLLVLAFGTPSPELAEALLGLFDAMGTSLRWVTR